VLRSAVGAIAVVALVATVALFGPMPKAFAAAGEETTWVGPLTGGTWRDAGNWSNGVPTDGSIIVFDTPVDLSNLDKPGGDARGLIFDFREGASGIVLNGSDEWRPHRIVVAAGVTVDFGLRILRHKDHPTLTIAMADGAHLFLRRQVEPEVFVESSRPAVEGPGQADLSGAVITIANEGTTSIIWGLPEWHLSGNVRLELDRALTGNNGRNDPMDGVSALEGQSASPTAGAVAWLRDEQLRAGAQLALARGLTAELNGHRQTLAGLSLENGTAQLGDGGRLVVNGPIGVTGDAQSLIAGGTLDLGAAPRTMEVGASALQIRSALVGTGGLDISLDGGALALDDACGYMGPVRLTGTGTVTAANGLGGDVTADPGVEVVDGSGGTCGGGVVEPVTPMSPPAHVAVAALSDAIGAEVIWEVPSPYPSDPVRSFEVYRSTEADGLGERIAELGASGNTFRYEDAFGDAFEPGSTLYYRVVALSASAASEPSEPVAFAIPGPPSAPGSLDVLNGRGQVKLSWPASTSERVDGYRVYREARYSYPTAEDPEAGSTPLAWQTPFGSAAAPEPNWTRIAEVPATQLEVLDDLTDPANATPDADDTVPSPAFPLDRSWNYVVTAYSELLGESAPVVVTAGTPSSVIELTMSIQQETDAYPGSSAVFTAEVANAGSGPTTAGKPLTARLLVPAGLPVRGLDPATQEWVGIGTDSPVDGDGDGAADWTCSASTIGDGTTVRCDYASTLAAMSWSAPLPFSLEVPEEAALGTVPISYSVAGYNASGELGIGSHKPFAFQVEARDRAALEVTTGFDGRLSADPSSPSALAVTVTNVGTAPTTASPVVTLDVPADVWLGDTSAAAPWTCDQAEPGADIVCSLDPSELLAGVLLAGVSTPQLTVPIGAPATPWHLGVAAARPIDVAAAAADAYDTVEGESRVMAQSALGATPSLHVEIAPRDPGYVAAGTSAFRVSATNLGGESRPRAVSFDLRMPGGVRLDLDAVSSAWRCEQTGAEASCASNAPMTLDHGQIVNGPMLRTLPLPDGLVTAGRWPLTAHATQDGIVGAPIDALVEVASPPASAVSRLSLQPAVSPLRSSQLSSVTVTLTGDANAGPAAPRAFAALLPPLVAASGVEPIALAGFGATTAAEWGECTIETTSRGDAVVCLTDAPVPQAATATVDIGFQAGREIAGALEFSAGFVEAADAAAAVAAIEASGAAALVARTTAVVEGVAFVADAGPAQEVSATVVSQDPTGEAVISPTIVRLAGSVEGALDAPVAYCWVQTGGPAVEWVAPDVGAGEVVPGSGGIPGFPDTTEVPDECAEAATHRFGAEAAFRAPATRDGAELTFRMVATDGAAVATAATEVVVAAAGNTPPAVEGIRVLREDGGDWVEVDDLTVAPAVGTPLRLEATLSDPDGDSVTVTPWLIAPKSAGVVFSELGSTRADATTTVRTIAFAWPSSVGILELGLTARDGYVSAGGVESTGTASLAIGAETTPSVPAPTTEPGDIPIDHEWRVAEGLDLEGWLANAPVVAGTAPAVGTVIVNEGAHWRPGPMTLTNLTLTVLGEAPSYCGTATDWLAAGGGSVLGLTADASIDWDGRDTKESDFEFPVRGCIVPGGGWDLVNAAAIKRLDIGDVPKTLTFRGVSFVASAGPGLDDPDEDYQFVGTAQSNGAVGPARMHVWVPDEDETGLGANTFAISIEARMADLSLYYGSDGFLLYSPTGLPHVSDIPGFDLSAAGASRNYDGCAESTDQHGNIPIPAGFSAVTNYQLDYDFCFALNTLLGIPVPGTMPMVTPITAVPKGTVYLSSGEYELFHEPVSGARASMTGLRLVYSPTIVQLISDGSLVLPDLVGVFSGGRLDAPSEPEPMDVSVGVTFGTNFVKEFSGNAFIQRTGAPWRDAFFIPGLDIGDLTLQAGFRVSREKWFDFDSAMKAIPEYAAELEILGLPEPIETVLGITGDEPIRAAGVITTSKPDTIWDFQLGIKDGHDFLKPLHVVDFGTGIEELITADVARLVLAPMGGTIGDKVYPFGVTAELWVEVFGVKLGLDLNADFLGLRLDGEAHLGQMTYAGMGVGHTDVDFVLDGLDPTAYFDFDSPELLFDGKKAGRFFARLGFGEDASDDEDEESEGDGTMSFASLVAAEPSTATVASSAPAPRAGGDPSRIALDVDIALDDVAIPGVASLDEARVWSHREFGLDADLTKPIVGLDMGMSASIDVLGEQVAVIGAVDLDQSGLHGFDLVGAAEPFEAYGTRIGGQGCGDVSGILPDGSAPVGFPTDGPCVRVALRPGEPNPYLVALSGSLTVPSAGIEAAFDGRLDSTGLAIDRARLQLTSDLRAEITDARFYAGPTVAAGMVTDTDRSGRTVTVANGDFRLRGSAQARLLGFAAKLRIDVGKIGSTAWADGLAEFDAFKGTGSPIQTDARLAGSFAKHGSDYDWSLEGAGAVSIQGYKLASADFSIGEQGGSAWFTLDGELKAGPITAELSGDLAWHGGLEMLLVGEASLDLGIGRADAEVRFEVGQRETTQVTGYKCEVKLLGICIQQTPIVSVVGVEPFAAASLRFSGQALGIIKLNGQAAFASNGDFTASGNAKVLGFTVDVDVAVAGGKTNATFEVAVWNGLRLTGVVQDSNKFGALASVKLPNLKVSANASKSGYGLSGYLRIDGAKLDVGFATADDVLVLTPQCAESEKVDFFGVKICPPLFGMLLDEGLYVHTAAKIEVGGCVKFAGRKKCDHWDRSIDLKLNPIKLCAEKSFNVLAKFKIEGCYEPPTTFKGKAKVRF